MPQSAAASVRKSARVPPGGAKNCPQSPRVFAECLQTLDVETVSAHPSLVVAEDVPSDSIAAFGEIFHTLKEAQILVANWRRLCNGPRPHT